ncbi:MAG TPA: flavodoxin [Spirochaetota bacterium]|nr:flavodoxin [Spirochaetota bacterium]HPJ36462.1 flavodoxin [Spirochaetota bacterium]
MKKQNIYFFIFIAVLVSGMLFAQKSGKKQKIQKKEKILIAYFTLAQNISDFPEGIDLLTHASVKLIKGEYMGDTEIVAGWIQQEVGGKMFSIKTANRYSSDFDTSVDQAGKELRSNARPVLTTHIPDIKKYDIVFLGYPMWHRDVPMAVYTFLETYNLSGKTIVPFAMHMGGGIGTSVRTIRKLEPDTSVLNPLVVSDYRLFESREEVKEWLHRIGFR